MGSAPEQPDGDGRGDRLEGIGVQVIETTTEQDLSEAEEEIASAFSLPDSEVTGKPLQERLYQYMSDASLSLSEMEPYFSYYPDKLYKNLVETRVIYNGILAQ